MEKKTKVYVTAPASLGRAIHRITAALIRHAPSWVEEVHTPEEADLRVWMVLGEGERSQLLETKQPYAIWQLCLRTSERPNTWDWLPVWSQSLLTVSYYDLPALFSEDGHGTWLGDFYHAPLGVDPAFLAHTSVEQLWHQFLIGTSGYVAATEGINEWQVVLDRLNAPLIPGSQRYSGFHLGPRLEGMWPQDWAVESGISDAALAGAWSSCKYIAAMRRIEGFEFPGIEGLVCGARPVCFDRPHYRQWYEDHAEYVPEGSFEEVVEALLRLVRSPYRPVTASEISWARQRFAWGPIVKGFWDRLEGTV